MRSNDIEKTREINEVARELIAAGVAGRWDRYVGKPHLTLLLAFAEKMGKLDEDEVEEVFPTLVNSILRVPMKDLTKYDWEAVAYAVDNQRGVFYPFGIEGLMAVKG